MTGTQTRRATLILSQPGGLRDGRQLPSIGPVVAPKLTVLRAFDQRSMRAEITYAYSSDDKNVL
jgi:hypothetical protein